VAARAKARTVFVRSNTGILGSNLTQGMDVCVCVYSVLVLGSGLATGWSPVQGVPPAVLDYETEVDEAFHRCPMLQVEATEEEKNVHLNRNNIQIKEL
jgi:hypothetical protein